MGLLVCFCCGRQREVKPIKKGARYSCSHCGAKQVRVIRSRAHASYISWTEKEGVDAEKARHDTYAGLKKYAQHRGYKNGWISNKFKQIYGRWPNGESVESASPASSGLLWWIKRANGIYAKEQRQREAADILSGKGGGSGLVNIGDRLSMGGDSNVDSVGVRCSATSPLMTDDDWGVKL